MTFPPMAYPTPSANAVTTGSRALRAACRSRMLRSGNPRMRQKVMKSSSITSNMVLRINRVGRPCKYKASVTAGRVRWRTKSADHTCAHQLAYMLPGLVAPVEGNQWNPPPLDPGAPACREHRRAKDAHDIGEGQRGKREGQGVGEDLAQHLTHRLSAEKRAAEFPAHQVLEVDAILHVQRLVQSELTLQRTLHVRGEG